MKSAGKTFAARPRCEIAAAGKTRATRRSRPAKLFEDPGPLQTNFEQKITKLAIEEVVGMPR